MCMDVQADLSWLGTLVRKYVFSDCDSYHEKKNSKKKVQFIRINRNRLSQLLTRYFLNQKY